MKKIEKLKAALKNMLLEFRSINTDKAVLSWDGEDDLAVDVTVYITDEEGNRNIPEDGEYVDENKITYVVENGIVREIIPAPEEEPEEQPEAPAEEPAEEPKVEEPVEEPVEEQPVEEPAEEEPTEEPVEEPAEEPVEEPAEEVENIAEEANELAEKVESLVEKINSLVEEVEQLKAFRKVVEDMTAGKPAQETFREVAIDPSRGNSEELKTIDKLFN